MKITIFFFFLLKEACLLSRILKTLLSPPKPKYLFNLVFLGQEIKIVLSKCFDKLLSTSNGISRNIFF